METFVKRGDLWPSFNFPTYNSLLVHFFLASSFILHLIHENVYACVCVSVFFFSLSAQQLLTSWTFFKRKIKHCFFLLYSCFEYEILDFLQYPFWKADEKSNACYDVIGLVQWPDIKIPIEKPSHPRFFFGSIITARAILLIHALPLSTHTKFVLNRPPALKSAVYQLFMNIFKIEVTLYLNNDAAGGLLTTTAFTLTSFTAPYVYCICMLQKLQHYY